MIRIERIELLGWDMQPDQYLLLRPGVNLLTGENGSGKTSILDAIKMVLGARRIGRDRTAEDYLRTRDPQVAMVRAVIDNRSDHANRRPFDALGGGYESDLVSLAVVFRATDDGYARQYHIVDGDLSPLTAGVETRPFSARDYRQRLDRLGLSASFRRLLATPQGEVASLCRQNPAELFDLLYDFIGGKEVYEHWQALRRDFEKVEKLRQEKAGALGRIEQDRQALSERVERHAAFTRYRTSLRRRTLALPLARRRELDAQRRAALSAGAAARGEVDELGRTAERLRGELRDARAAHGATDDDDRRLDARFDAQRTARRAVERELADARARWARLDAVRREAEGLPVRDARALAEQAEAARAERAGIDHEAGRVTSVREALVAERARIDKGVLDPPAAVERLREALNRAKIPHGLLLDLIEPVEPDGPDRKAIESFLGDLRFAIAVTDEASFVQAVDLARAQRFPYYVLTPDIRSRAPERGAHPLLDGVRVKDKRYAGLVIRLLRRVERLEGPVEGTFGGRGAQVDAEGYVLDRIGGIHRGTARFYLGRDALARRRAEIERALVDLDGQRRQLEVQRAELTRQIEALDRALTEEARRQAWLAIRAEHAEVGVERQRLEERRQDAEDAEERVMQARRALFEKREALGRRVTRLEIEVERAEERAESRRRASDDARAEAEAADLKLARLRDAIAASEAALAEATERERDAVAREVDESGPAWLERLIAEDEKAIERFPPADRDPALPENLRTLERQLQAVRGEFERIKRQVEAAREAVEQAHDQYVRATRLQFRAYFGRVKAEAARLDFHVEGKLREREDGRFEVVMDVAVGQKAPVPYSSRALSGGQKAALSILMAMNTLGEAGGAGFFLVDEPFSASDTHKIQELGAFLGRTGAQYLVSMPTSLDIGRCGDWLEGVLTCTRTAGGFLPDGSLRLAPPVKFGFRAPDGAA